MKELKKRIARTFRDLTFMAVGAAIVIAYLAISKATMHEVIDRRTEHVYDTYYVVEAKSYQNCFGHKFSQEEVTVLGKKQY